MIPAIKVNNAVRKGKGRKEDQQPLITLLLTSRTARTRPGDHVTHVT